MRRFPISPIYRMGHSSAQADPMEQWGRQEKLRRDAWQRLGLVVVRPEELPDHLGPAIEQWASDTYGRRK